ncbi:MAG: hypothetical protein QME55_07125 [Brevundimonas sp.]|uniref:hypothetical protein n=1 Tax=Brevundimonas sp. TaxID=1871086 RepID=UPI00262AAA59|nr:hypothetical protein [Brevundimonas sp.]MDI6624484.1 hypothetical protein [Brevundimonas sp.]MDQ7811773.1 hypothetical protein [Brevundimonas sp.]
MTMEPAADLLSEPRQGVVSGNLKEPVLLADVMIDGIAAEAKPKGVETASIWNRLAITSDHPVFHRVVEGLGRVLNYKLDQAEARQHIDRANSVVVVIKPDNTAKVWLDGAAVIIEMLALRDMPAGSPVYDRDIGDVTGLWFPSIEVETHDRLIVIFREGWRFALFFDFTRDLPIEDAKRALGQLYRLLKYRELYDLLGNSDQFDRLIKAGWFPFTEIVSADFRELLGACENGFDFDDAEEKLLAKFDPDRLDRMLARWAAKPHLASREPLLREAVETFKDGKSISVLKIILTEIEGVLRDAHKAATGESAKLPALLKFAATSGERRAGAPDTLLFPAAFCRYLESYTFANFDPNQDAGSAGSRHAVGHGAAASASYTRIRALQALLTLDQLAFYT